MSAPQLSFTAHLTAKPGHLPELKAAINTVLTHVRELPDFIQAYVNESHSSPDSVVLYEQWSCSAEKMKTHYMAMPFFQQFKAELQPILLHEQKTEMMTPTAHWTGTGKQGQARHGAWKGRECDRLTAGGD